MTAWRLWSDVASLTREALDGDTSAWSYIVQLDGDGGCVRTLARPDDQVALVIGNGRGQESVIRGLVGEGLCDGDVTRLRFEAPSANRIREGLELVDREAGVLPCASNDSGEVVNAEIALERHGPRREPAELAVFGDEVAAGWICWREITPRCYGNAMQNPPCQGVGRWS